MKKTILVNGLIAGALVSGFMLYMINNFSYCSGDVDYNTSMLLGYASMIIAFSLVFTGIRNYRNNYNGGIISFGKAFKVGILIVLIAATVYVIAWLIAYYFFIPDFAERMSAKVLGELKAGGAAQTAIDKQTKEMAGFVQMYKNPLFVILMTYVEILPVGLLVTLISAAILKRKTAVDLHA